MEIEEIGWNVGKALEKPNFQCFGGGGCKDQQKENKAFLLNA